MHATIALLAVLLAAPKPSPAAKVERLLVGSWECVSACPDEEIAFAIESGVRRYSSWLHNRPSVAGATWQLDGTRVTVRRDAAVLYDWEIVRLTRVRLELKEDGEQANVVMRRIR